MDHDIDRESLNKYPPPPPYVEVESISVPIVPIKSPTKPVTSNICGCGAETWTCIIAGIQVFGSLSIIFFAFVPKVRPAEVLDGSEETEFFELSSFDKVKVIYMQYASDPTVQIVNGSIGLFQGCILFVGARLEKPALVVIWLIGTGIGLGAFTLLLLILLLLFIFGGGSFLLLIILIVLVPFLIQLFCFSVVSIHRHEIIHIQKHNRLHPILQPIPLASLNPDMDLEKQHRF